MRKIGILLGVLLVTGCSSKLVCTKNVDQEGYQTKEKIIFKFDKNDKVLGSEIEHVLTFEDEETAESQFKAFSALQNDFEMSIEKNKIIMKTSSDYSQYEHNKKELKEEMEKNEYLCR